MWTQLVGITAALQVGLAHCWEANPILSTSGWANRKALFRAEHGVISSLQHWYHYMQLPEVKTSSEITSFLTRNWLNSIHNDFVFISLFSLYERFSNYLYCSHFFPHHTRTALIKYMCKYPQKCELCVSSFCPQMVELGKDILTEPTYFHSQTWYYWSQSNYPRLP